MSCKTEGRLDKTSSGSCNTFFTLITSNFFSARNQLVENCRQTVSFNSKPQFRNTSFQVFFSVLTSFYIFLFALFFSYMWKNFKRQYLQFDTGTVNRFAIDTVFAEIRCN